MSGRLSAARALALDLTLAEVVSALRERDVHCLLLKGPALAQLIYADPDERGYDDIDLIVAPESRATAERVLHELGFRSYCEGWRASERAHHAEPWERMAPLEACVDLHRTLALLPAEPALVWQALSRDAEALQIAGEHIWVPSTAARALTIALHAAQHGPKQARPLADLQRAVQRLNVELWREALALARELGAVDGLAGGLRMCEPGAALADELGLGAPLSPHVRLSAAGAPATWRAFERLQAERSLRRRAAMIAGRLWPSLGLMRAYRPDLVTSPTGLLRAYAWRPLSLLLQAPRGWRAWRAAQPDAAGRLDSARRACWAARSLRRTRRSPRNGANDGPALLRPPRTVGSSERGIGWALRHARATCLERASIRQAWLHSRGEDRALVIGVATAGGFRAHAWLEGEEDPGEYLELLRRTPHGTEVATNA